MKNNRFLIALVCCLSFYACKDDTIPPGPGGGGGNNNSRAWLIPEAEVFDGGPGKDGIPSVDNPQFTDVANAPEELDNNSLVVGVNIEGEVRAYPHFILDWHEIVNDQIGSHKFSLNYCPLTGTAMVWSRVINKRETTFGVSGLLYQTNIIPYDRLTESNWSQLQIRSVQGQLAGTEAELYPVVETTWGNWKSMYPHTQVMTKETGFNRNYGVYPYGGYREDNDWLLFPVSPLDKRVPAKERVLGIRVGEKFRTYRQSVFSENTLVRNEIFNDSDIVVGGNKNANLFVAFKRKLEDGTVLQMSSVQNALPVIMVDQEGNEWDVFGQAVSGPRKGSRLGVFPALMGYWFSFGAFYPDHELIN